VCGGVGLHAEFVKSYLRESAAFRLVELSRILNILACIEETILHGFLGFGTGCRPSVYKAPCVLYEEDDDMEL
jgi:hypothetical protein